MSEDVDRVVVFMDYQNLHGWAPWCLLRYAYGAHISTKLPRCLLSAKGKAKH